MMKRAWFRSDHNPAGAMDRNAFGFLTLVILGLCYLVYISKNETQSDRPSYTIGVYNGLVQREMNVASKRDWYPPWLSTLV